MVPSNEEGEGTSDQGPSSAQAKSKKGKSPAPTTSTNKMSANVEKDSEEYRKLRERNNEAVKKSRTRTRLRTQSTLDKVEKLRSENGKLEDRIEGLKKELDLLKELFVSHAGTKSMKRLTEVDLDVLLAEAGPNSKKAKKNGTPYTGRSREIIEKEVQALLGQDPEESELDDGAQPSTSRDGMEEEEQADNSEVMDESTAGAMAEGDGTVSVSVDDAVNEALGGAATYTIVGDGWTTENDGDAVVVTIEQAVEGEQPSLHDIMEGEILMLE